LVSLSIDADQCVRSGKTGNNQFAQINPGYGINNAAVFTMCSKPDKYLIYLVPEVGIEPT
jgi:hypothetical protein